MAIVSIIDPNPENLANCCRAAKVTIGTVGGMDNKSPSEQADYIRKLVLMGHTSILEHAVFSFQIDQLSIACARHLVRHRMASYHEMSMRNLELPRQFVIPEAISRKADALALYSKHMALCLAVYKELRELGVLKEDARYVQPVGWVTSVFTTRNARELLNFFKQRLDKRAQWEIKDIARQMLESVNQYFPIFTEEVLTSPCQVKTEL